MGTSKSNSGPGNNSPLLPPWAPDPINGEGEQEGNDNNDSESPKEDKGKETPVLRNLSTARRGLTTYVKNRSRRTFNSAIRSYVKSYGGGRRASTTAISGKSAGRRLTGFIAGVSNQGINTTLNEFGLGDCIGKPIDFVLTKIADLLAPSGATNEDAAAREAILDSLEYIYQEYELYDKELTELDSLQVTDLEVIIKEYVSSYIFNRWLHELGLKLEEKAASTHELVRIEKEAKNYIKEAVDLDFSQIDIMNIDFREGVERDLMDGIFEEAYILTEEL